LKAVFDLFRRLIAAALLLTAALCVAEVALRFQRTRDAAQANPNYGVAPSRLTMYELPRLATVEAPSAATGTRHRWEVNSLGLRGPEPDIPKPAGALRIVWLGDETILAPRLSEEETSPQRLASLVRQQGSSSVEVINAGLPAGCPLTAAVAFRQTLLAMAPDLVLVHVDLSDALDDRRCRSFLRLEAGGDPLAVVHPKFDIPDSPLCGWDHSFALIDWARGRSMQRCIAPRETTSFDDFQASLAAWQQAPSTSSDGAVPALAPLAALNRLVQSRSCEMIVCTCPNAWQTAELLRGRSGSPSSVPADLLQQPTAALKRIAEELQAPFVDATPAFLEHPSPRELYLPETGRLSSAGQALYAEVLARFLTAPAGPAPRPAGSVSSRR
jgi:hypothetical protein